MGHTIEQLEDLFVRFGEKPYRGRQLFKWLYNGRQYDFNNMTDLAKELRTKLSERCDIRGLQLDKRTRSADGAEKFLFRLEDGCAIETVLIPDRNRSTVCLSSQVGCALACRFCATGAMGFRRNLTVGEIVGQLVFLRELYGDDCFTNVVFMGMGEPLLNYENLVNALRIMCSSSGLRIAAKRTCVSTSGIVPKIRELADSGLKALLAVSLNAATQEKRYEIMPVAESYNLEELIEAVRYYTARTGRRVAFEDVLLEGFNDGEEDILALSRLVRGIPCKINLLSYNPVQGLGFGCPSDEKVDWFAKKLHPRAPAVTVRKSRGRDIGAACGQLAIYNNGV